MKVEEFIKYVKENYDMDLTVKPSETPDNFDKLFFTNDSCKNCSSNPKRGEKMEYENIVVQVSNYATDYLQDTLTKYGLHGFKLVDVIRAQNQYGADVMYLFFTRKLEEEI